MTTVHCGAQLPTFPGEATLIASWEALALLSPGARVSHHDRGLAVVPAWAPLNNAIAAMTADTSTLVMTRTLTLGLGTDCGLYAVGTVPGMRRRGLATALVEHVLADAYRRGARTASPQSTEMDEPLYRSMGFTPVQPGSAGTTGTALPFELSSRRRRTRPPCSTATSRRAGCWSTGPWLSRVPGASPGWSSRRPRPR